MQVLPNHHRRVSMVPGVGGLRMALERGRIIGYDTVRMTFRFTMIDANTAATVDCTISSAAMDQLDGSKKTMPSEREAQFLRLRDKIERLASDLFNKDPTKPARLIRIFYHHITVRKNA
jgi:hypothetical protein